MAYDRQYDVVVVGGGAAGVAAALAAARAGVSTALIEKTVLWGGLCTSGLVPIYMPLCDGHGRQVTFGIAEELLHASIKYGPDNLPARWRRTRGGSGGEAPAPDAGSDQRYMTFYAPMPFVLGLDELLADCGAELWLDTLACEPILDRSRLVGLAVENKSGRLRLGAACVVDATGDADLAARAGAPCDTNRSDPSILYQFTSLSRAREAVEAGTAERLATWRSGGANEFDTGYDGPLGPLSGLSGKEVSTFVMEGRRVAREAIAAAQRALGPTGRRDLYPTMLPAMAQFRMTRKVRGRETVGEPPNQRCDTSIGLITDCRKTGDVWEVPYGALLPQGVTHLLVAGRCIACEGYAWQVTRLIPAAAMTGEVAGVAAATAVRAGTSPEQLSTADLQAALEQRGFALHV